MTTGEGRLGEKMADVTRRYRTSMLELRSKRQHKFLWFPRKELVVFARDELHWSYPQIAEMMGRDFSTIRTMYNRNPAPPVGKPTPYDELVRVHGIYIRSQNVRQVPVSSDILFALTSYAHWWYAWCIYHGHTFESLEQQFPWEKRTAIHGPNYPTPARGTKVLHRSAGSEVERARQDHPDTAGGA